MSAWLFVTIRIALTALLYLFLGSVVYTLWMDMRRQAEGIRIHQAVAVIKLMLNTENGVKASQFTKTPVTIGRDPGCDFLLDDKTVSSRHTRLSFHHNQWWVEDLGSTNGTFLNQEPVSATIVLTTGDQIRCGNINLSIQISE